MNSNKVIVSGKNATASVFISLSQSQKEEAERLEYEIKNSHTSTEEEAENWAGILRNCDCCKKECVCGKEDDVSDDESDDDYSDYDSDEEEPEEKSSYIVGEKQKPRVERKSWYRVKKEEEEAEPEGDFTKNQLREQLQHMRNSRDYYKDREAILNNALDKKDEEIKKLDEENTKLLSENEDAKQGAEAYAECIKELEDENKSLKKQLKEVNEEADMAVHNHSVDAKALFKEIALNNKLREEIEELKEELKERDKVIGKIQSNMFTLRTTIEARDESIKTICDERSTLYDIIQMLKKELREEKIFRRDNEDNFFRLLDKYNRCEKALKKVTI